MPRERNKENRGLPARWRWLHGAYRYQVPPGQEHQWGGKKTFTLGKTLAEAYRTWAERVEWNSKVTYVCDLLDRYEVEVVPNKAPRTQIDDRKKLPILRKRFGNASVQPGPGGIEPRHIYEYVSRNTHRLTAAHREVELLSHAFTMAVNWGLIKQHPWKGSGITLQRELRPKPRERYVDDWEILEVLSLPPRRRRGSVLMLQAYIRVKLLTGLRKTDLLWLPATLGEHGLDVHPSKTRHSTGVRQRFAWTPELRQAIEMALAARPIDGPWLFMNRFGEPLIAEDQTTSTFDSQWHRFINRCLKETALEQRFAERDLRAKVATDAESLERAQALLAHADARLTQRVYTRRPRLIQPAKGVVE